MKMDLKRSSSLYFLIIAIIGLINIVVFWFSQKESSENEALVIHTHEVIQLSTELLSSIKDAETGQRGYLLTLNEEYLKPYIEGVNASQQKLSLLKDKISNNMIQQARIDSIKQLLDSKLDELGETIALA